MPDGGVRFRTRKKRGAEVSAPLITGHAEFQVISV